MFVLQESCKLKFHLARILQDEVYLARNLPEKCIVLQDLARHLARFLQDLYFFQLGWLSSLYETGTQLKVIVKK